MNFNTTCLLERAGKTKYGRQKDSEPREEKLMTPMSISTRASQYQIRHPSSHPSRALAHWISFVPSHPSTAHTPSRNFLQVFPASGPTSRQSRPPSGLQFSMLEHPLPALWQSVYLCARTFPTLLHMDSDSTSFRRIEFRVRGAWLESYRLCFWRQPCGPMVAVYQAVLRMLGEWTVDDRPRLVCSLLLFSSCPSTRQPCCHTRCEIP